MSRAVCAAVCYLYAVVCCATVRYKPCATRCGVLLWCAMSCVPWCSVSCVLRCAVSCVLRCAVSCELCAVCCVLCAAVCCVLRCAVSCVVCSQFKLPHGGLWEDLADQYAFHADRRSIDHSHYLLWYPDPPSTQHCALLTVVQQDSLKSTYPDSNPHHKTREKSDPDSNPLHLTNRFFRAHGQIRCENTNAECPLLLSWRWLKISATLMS